MSDIPLIPKVAEDTNYDAGTDPWCGQPTKAVPPSSFENKGWIPGVPPATVYENYHKHNVCAVLKDTQARAIVKQCASGAMTGMIGAYLPVTHIYAGSVDSTGQKVAGRIPNDPSKYVATATTAPNYQLVDAYAYDRNVHKLAFWDGIAIGASGGWTVVLDTKARTVSTATPPHTNARYTDGCTDVTTGNAVVVSAKNPGTPAYGFAYGDPAAMTFTAAGAGTGWTSDDDTTVASKPGEVRAFSKAKTFASVDGGVTCGAVADTVWTAGLTAGSFMYRPTWDAANSRWVVSTAKVSVDSDTASTSSKLWTSTDGITWTTLVASPDFLFLDILYHRGWLWAIVVPLSYTGHNDHEGAEVLFSRDGGTTWYRHNILISMRTPGHPWFTARIVACDSHLMCSVSESSTGVGDHEYVVIELGDAT